MSEEERFEIEKLEGHYCFACGTANPIGLNLEFYRRGDSVYTDITLDKYHEGWENMAHGGIISTLLDEVMAWTIMYTKRKLFVTRKMEIKYIRPVLIGMPLTVNGLIIDKFEHPRIAAKAEIRDNEGKLYVRSQGEFVMLSEEDLPSVPEGMKREMFSLFERFNLS